MKIIILSLTLLLASCGSRAPEPPPITTVYSLRTGEQVPIPPDPHDCIEQMEYHGVSVGVCQDVAW